MTGIRVGSRLEQLERLLANVQQEIAQERHRLALEASKRAPSWKAFERTKTGNPAGDLCTQLGVTPKHVKEWAVQVGLLERVARGRLALPIVQAYAEAHR